MRTTMIVLMLAVFMMAGAVGAETPAATFKLEQVADAITALDSVAVEINMTGQPETIVIRCEKPSTEYPNGLILVPFSSRHQLIILIDAKTGEYIGERPKPPPAALGTFHMYSYQTAIEHLNTMIKTRKDVFAIAEFQAESDHLRKFFDELVAVQKISADKTRASFPMTERVLDLFMRGGMDKNFYIVWNGKWHTGVMNVGYFYGDDWKLKDINISMELKYENQREDYVLQIKPNGNMTGIMKRRLFNSDDESRILSDKVTQGFFESLSRGLFLNEMPTYPAFVDSVVAVFDRRPSSYIFNWSVGRRGTIDYVEEEMGSFITITSADSVLTPPTPKGEILLDVKYPRLKWRILVDKTWKKLLYVVKEFHSGVWRDYMPMEAEMKDAIAVMRAFN